MIVTIMTDASHCTQTKAAGFGFWIASNRGKLSGGKPMTTHCIGSHDSEFKAVANTLHIAIKSGLVCTGDRVIIQLDNVAVVNSINTGKTKVKNSQAALKFILDSAKDYCLELKSRHVKGHTNLTESRYAANNHCDRIAKQQMRMARKILKSGIAV